MKFMKMQLGDFQECLPPFGETSPTPFAKGGRGDFLWGQGN